ncbi:hypothetical protein HY993_01070, partial [Candidatus Micrarchaeota archaeon]|nr:hypothetical protein [Candidatus Micrarchaeota archaeon]
TLNALNSSGQASECLFEIRASIADSCQSTALRQAFLEFNSTIVFFDENRTQSLNVTPREFSSYANSFGTIGFPGFVLPLSEVNSSIDVMIISAIEGGALTNVLAQQTSLEGYTDTVGGAYVLGTVVLYGDKGRVYWPISWEKRGSVNSAAVRDFLNQSPARLNLSWFDFTNDTLVRITGVAYSAQNQSFLEKQDFVSSVDYKNGEFQLAIKDGFTDKKRVEELAKKIDQVGIAKTVFPDSAIIFTFSPNSNFSQSVEFVKSVVSADARIQVSAVVLLNATKASLATGIIMPKLLQESAYVFYSPGQKTGRDARMLVSAIARNKIPLQIDAVEN